MCAISSCNSKAPNATEIIAQTPTDIPIATEIIAQTPPDMPNATEIISQTPTDRPNVKLAKFNAEMLSISTHGNMTCIIYQGEKLDLMDLTIRASFFQGEQKIEEGIAPEEINGKHVLR